MASPAWRKASLKFVCCVPGCGRIGIYKARSTDLSACEAEFVTACREHRADTTVGVLPVGKALGWGRNCSTPRERHPTVEITPIIKARKGGFKKDFDEYCIERPFVLFYCTHERPAHPLYQQWDGASSWEFDHTAAVLPVFLNGKRKILPPMCFDLSAQRSGKRKQSVLRSGDSKYLLEHPEHLVDYVAVYFQELVHSRLHNIPIFDAANFWSYVYGSTCADGAPEGVADAAFRARRARMFASPVPLPGITRKPRVIYHNRETGEDEYLSPQATRKWFCSLFAHLTQTVVDQFIAERAGYPVMILYTPRAYDDYSDMFTTADVLYYMLTCPAAGTPLPWTL